MRKNLLFVSAYWRQMALIAFSSKVFTVNFCCSFFVSFNWSRKSFTHLTTSYSCNLRCINTIRFLCSCKGIFSARSMLVAISLMSVGFTSRASFNSLAAPASSLKINTPVREIELATNSFATRFIPSRSGVIRATSASWYKADNSWKGRCWYR